MLQMLVHGALADVELTGDGTGRQPTSDELKHSLLSGRQ
jgi:hypothetical protein